MRALSHNIRAILILIATVICCVGRCDQACCKEPRRDPVTGKIRVIYMGDVFGLDYKPYRAIWTDPFFQATAVPASLKHVFDVYRLMRIYMPRSYQKLVDSYDLLIVCDTACNLYQPFQLEWFRAAVQLEGLGLLMVGGEESFGAYLEYMSWGDCSVASVLPVECQHGASFQQTSFKPAPMIAEHPFVTSLPFNTMPPLYGLNVVVPKIGSEVIFVTNIQPHYPILVYWECGNGSSVAHTPGWRGAWGEELPNWEYYEDYLANLLFLTSNIPVPQDLESRHLARKRLDDCLAEKSLLLGVLEFVEMFGGDTHTLQPGLKELEDLRKEAQQLYLELDFEGALSKLDQAQKEFEALSRRALKLRDRALVWVYLVEYLAVTGTAMASGFVLWTLMIRRRAFAEVGVTRLPSERRTL